MAELACFSASEVWLPASLETMLEPPRSQGTLYVVATPIGNLEDISRRALRVLSEVDLIAAEDTRRTRKLLSHYRISTRLQSYYDAVERQRTPALLRKLREGQKIALVSEAGTPTISDPGYRLINAARDEGVEVVAVPGASAVLALIVASGLPCDRFAFEGFLSAKAGARRRRLATLATDDRTLIFFESPRRVHALLEDMLAALGDREAALGRELTKLNEEVIRGSLSDLQELVSHGQLHGEVTIAVAALPRKGRRISLPVNSAAFAEAANELASRGLGAKEIAGILALRFGISKREAYRLVTRGPSLRIPRRAVDDNGIG